MPWLCRRRPRTSLGSGRCIGSGARLARSGRLVRPPRPSRCARARSPSPASASPYQRQAEARENGRRQPHAVRRLRARPSQLSLARPQPHAQPGAGGGVASVRLRRPRQQPVIAGPGCSADHAAISRILPVPCEPGTTLRGAFKKIRRGPEGGERCSTNYMPSLCVDHLPVVRLAAHAHRNPGTEACGLIWRMRGDNATAMSSLTRRALSRQRRTDPRADSVKTI
jgi:hypothetical protein